jgi:ribosomal protein S21
MPNPLEVNVNGDLERAFKNLKKKMAFEGIFKKRLRGGDLKRSEDCRPRAKRENMSI